MIPNIVFLFLNSLNLSETGVFVSVGFRQVCLGSAELHVEVDADGHVALVVGHIETEKLLFLGLLLVVEQGEDEAVVGLPVVGFPVFLATIDEGLFLYFLACRHREMDAVTELVVFGGEGAGKGEDGEHIVVAFVALVVVFRPLAVAVEIVLLHMALPLGVGVPHFIDGVVLAFE